MGFLLAFLLFSFLPSSYSFLFDNKNTTSASLQSSLTDQHYITVVDMVERERQERERYMEQLKQKILELDNRVSSIITVTNNNVTESQETQKLLNLTRVLQTDLQLLNVEYNLLQLKYSSLMDDFQNLTNRFDELRNTYYSSNNEHELVKHELESIKSLKTIDQLNDLQTLRNDSLDLKQQIHATNLRIDSVESTQKARGDDVIALYNLTTKVAQKLEEKISVTACVGSTVADANVPIRFNMIVTHSGLDNLTSFQSSGKFTCQSSGLYLISFTFMSDLYDSYFNIYRNTTFLNGVFTQDIKSGEFASGTATVVVDLNEGDEIYVKPKGRASLWDSDKKSTCITIVKLR